MYKRLADRPTDGRREHAHGDMLKAALARPGVREMMEVHGTWQDHDRALIRIVRSREAPGERRRQIRRVITEWIGRDGLPLAHVWQIADPVQVTVDPSTANFMKHWGRVFARGDDLCAEG